jgi:hypothetical protein
LHAVALDRAAYTGFRTTQSRDGREGQWFAGHAFAALFLACHLDARAGPVEFDLQILPGGDDISGDAARAFEMADLAAIQQHAVPLVGSRLGMRMQRKQQQQESDGSEHCGKPGRQSLIVTHSGSTWFHSCGGAGLARKKPRTCAANVASPRVDQLPLRMCGSICQWPLRRVSMGRKRDL